MNLDDVDRWVAGYVRAWTSNDPDDIGALFTDDAQYRTEPYADPWLGRDEIVLRWLDGKDEPGTWQFRSEPLALAGDLAFVRGWTDYTDGELRHYHNLWVIGLAEGGRASEFTEWFMKQR
ncbi:MAG: nuclear transport factor 2 family protein [Actinomycetota bacterium]